MDWMPRNSRIPGDARTTCSENMHGPRKCWNSAAMVPIRLRILPMISALSVYTARSLNTTLRGCAIFWMPTTDEQEIMFASKKSWRSLAIRKAHRLQVLSTRGARLTGLMLACSGKITRLWLPARDLIGNSAESAPDYSDFDDVQVSVLDSPYFAETSERIGQALFANAKSSAHFPENEQEFRQVLQEHGIDWDALRDPWGRPYRFRSSIEFAYGDKITVQAYGQQTSTQATPVTRKL